VTKPTAKKRITRPRSDGVKIRTTDLTPSRSGRGATAKPYHRVDLELELLDKAAEMIAEGGIESLSLRELGRALGVSRAAPYHYFEDKSALLRRVGERGFENLSARMDREIGRERAPLKQLRLGLAGYVAFAIEQPHFFRLMFASVLPRDLPVDLDAKSTSPFSSDAAATAFLKLAHGIRDAMAAGLLRSSDPLLLAQVLWSFTHGVAVLACGNHFKLRAARAVLQSGLDSLLREHQP
jgi:AcrR family transcriptional regulator